MSIKDYYDENRLWMRAQKVVGEKFYRGVYGEEREKRHYVRKFDGAIPGC